MVIAEHIKMQSSLLHRLVELVWPDLATCYRLGYFWEPFLAKRE